MHRRKVSPARHRVLDETRESAASPAASRDEEDAETTHKGRRPLPVWQGWQSLRRRLFAWNGSLGLSSTLSVSNSSCFPKRLSHEIPEEYRPLVAIILSAILVLMLSIVTGAFSSSALVQPWLRVKMPDRTSGQQSTATARLGVLRLPGPFASTTQDWERPDHGGLEFEPLADEAQSVRRIQYDANHFFTNEEDGAVGQKNDMHSEDPKVKDPSKAKSLLLPPCRRPSLGMTPSTCNDIHSLANLWTDFGTDSALLSAFMGGDCQRDVWALPRLGPVPMTTITSKDESQDDVVDDDNSSVVENDQSQTLSKQFVGDKNPANTILLQTASLAAYASEHVTRTEALVTAALVPHLRIVPIYGACAASLVRVTSLKTDAEEGIEDNGGSIVDVESVAVPIYDRQHCLTFRLADQESIRLNDLDPTTKLEWALQMAESIALLHHHPDGVIVHGNVQPHQWVVDAYSGTIQLNDFGQAQFMLYDEEHGEYCRYHNGVGHGDFRSPEENIDAQLNEKIDVYSLGNTFYSLLTGLHPLHDFCDEVHVGEHVADGRRPFIDERWLEESFAEAELVRIIRNCWRQHPENRPSAGELVLTLRESVKMNRQLIAQQQLEDNVVSNSDQEAITI